MKVPVTALLAILAAASSAGARPVRIEVTRDNSIVLYRGEYHLNAGRKTRIRIKGNQHLVAMAFDMRPLAGKLIESATLVCHRAAHDIDQVAVSTIQADWDEQKSNALTSGLQGAEGWGVPGARFPTVTGGNSFSLVCHAKSAVRNGAYHWNIAPDLV
ncbi:unnamed protein product, partial [marine sediment metagenome]